MYQKHCSIVKQISPHNAAAITFYYYFKNDMGEKYHDNIENLMADIDDKTAPIFNKIENQERLTENELRTFSPFFLLMRIRVPKF